MHVAGGMMGPCGSIMLYVENTITLQGVSLASLHASDFQFV